MPKSSLARKPGRVSLQAEKKPTRVEGMLRTCLNHQDVRDLHVLWARDQRIPTAVSRQRWAQKRGLAPSTVGGWFSRRRARQIRLEGDEAVLTGSYELNASSPSNVAPHEIPEKVLVRGSRARSRARTAERGGGADFGTGSDRTDPDQSSDDPPAVYHLGELNPEANLADAVETVITMDFNGEDMLPSSGLLCHGDCVLCVSAPPSPPTLRLPWSVQPAETAGQPDFDLSETGALELFPDLEFMQGLGQWPATL